MAHILPRENGPELCLFDRLPSIIRGPSRSVNDRHPCMCDERIRRDCFQNFQHSANYVHEEQSSDEQAVAFSF